MLAKITSAMALTLLLTGSALAFIPQPQESPATEPVAVEPAQAEQSSELVTVEPAQAEQSPELVAVEPAQPEQSSELVAVEPAQSEQSLQTEPVAAEQHNIYTGHNNTVQPQESLEAQLFAADTMVSEPRQFD